MSATSTVLVATGFSKRRLLQVLVAAYTLLWIAMSISPVDRGDWLLENLLTFLFVGILVGTYNQFQFSDRSYVLIAIFMCLHAVGAHYTYGQVPIGYWLKDNLHLIRNPFDRIAHFSFGLLMAYPMQELLIRTARLNRFWAYYLPLDGVLALSAIYEILEAWAAQMVTPALADAYLGTQGDLWDSQNDMLSAFLGSVVAMAITYALTRRTERTRG